jgi:hypothetical protein
VAHDVRWRSSRLPETTPGCGIDHLAVLHLRTAIEEVVVPQRTDDQTMTCLPNPAGSDYNPAIRILVRFCG